MRYAFIDAQNTETTTSKILGFVIDWKKLFLHLKDKWHCEKIFFYSGIQSGDGDIVLEYQKLEKLGYIIRAKPYYSPWAKIFCVKVFHKVKKFNRRKTGKSFLFGYQ